MDSPENSSAAETPGLAAWEMLEQRWFTFVINHTRELSDVPRYVSMEAGAVRARIKKYQIPRLPKNHYQGPVLSQQEMANAFFASLAGAVARLPVTLEVLARAVNVTLGPPDGPIVTVPMSAVLPQNVRRGSTPSSID